jgi:glucosamine-6-phosphate deaminase
MSNASSASKSSSPTKTFQIDALAVRLHRCSSGLAQDAALLARNDLQSLIAQQGAPTIILATGNSQIQFLEALIGLGGIDWSRDPRLCFSSGC